MKDSNVRALLTYLAFDWENGTIIYEEVMDDSSPGWSTNNKKAVIIDRNHPILDEEFSSGYGSPQCPRIFARDEKAIYFPVQYDGATWMEKILIDPQEYINKNIPIPYPGG